MSPPGPAGDLGSGDLGSGDLGSGDLGSGDVAQAKDRRRRTLLAARRARPDVTRRDDAAELAAGLPALLDGVPDPICLHVPVGHEPGATPDGAIPILDSAVTMGRRVLLPVTVGTAPMDWAAFTGRDSLAPGPYGLLEPVGTRHGPAAISGAGLVLVPALAVDRRGVRLGRGAGHYDRSLAGVPGRVRLVALVGDDELLDAPLPAAAHDVGVHAVWRPRHGVVELPRVDPGGTT